jgi:hypothetical protein
MRLTSALACAASLPLLIGAAEPIRLLASSPWDLDYAENSCRLLRTFGEGTSKVLLLIESAVPGQMDMLVVGNPIKTGGDTVAARFVPAGVETFDGEVTQAASNRTPGILWSSVRMLPDQTYDRLQKEMKKREHNTGKRPPPLDLAEEAERKAERQAFATRSTQLEIQTSKKKPLILETGSMGEPIRLFDKCSRDSLKDWGVNPDLEDKIVRPVWAADPRSWFSSADYPTEMLNSGEQSDVTVRVLVDATGKVTKCTSISHFKEKVFNDITCARFTERARFEPAELADGTRVPSYYAVRVKFRIGGF